MKKCNFKLFFFLLFKYNTQKSISDPADFSLKSPQQKIIQFCKTIVIIENDTKKFKNIFENFFLNMIIVFV